jgi:hypothetical protein
MHLREGILVGDRYITAAGLAKASRAQKAPLNIFELLEPTIDNSTGPDTVSTVSPLTLNGDHYTRTTTIRDMTAQEIEDRNTAEIEGQFSEAQMEGIWLLFNAAFYAIKNPAVGGLTPQSFKAAMNDPDNMVIPKENLVTWLRERVKGA